MRLLASFTAIVLVACSRRDASPVADSTAGGTTGARTSTEQPNNWAPELGRLLLVPSDSDNVALVLFPETPTPQSMSSAPVTLVNTSGDTTATRVGALIPDTVECGDTPMVRFAGAVPPAWAVGFSARTAALLRMDSIEALPPADSVRLAADLARLASALPMQKNSRFAGLPFAVASARRFDANGRQIVIAQLVRRLPQEASPLEERTLLIAERATASAAPASRGEPLAVTYSQRSEGSEDAVEHFEPLSAIRAGPATLILLSRDQLSRTTYELLERTDDGWRTRWSRTLAC